MLILFIILTGIVVGILPGLLKLEEKVGIVNMVIGIVGALVGALIGFGDAPMFLKHSFLNEKTLTVAVSILFVLSKVAMTRKRIAP